ncbi:LysR family transcriptional regulator [Brucella pseudogrignonensis]|nr:LysR family transcriptional regulator [Brucella pseudogrignonensis]
MIALIQALAVAEYLSFQRAALALGTSQSSVSARIKALEEELGIVLFDRNTRGVRLTEAGRRFINQVRDAIGILDHAVKTAGMQRRGGEGELRIGVHALTEDCFVDRLLKRFHVKHPAIQLHITEGAARAAQFLVREGKLDVAFMACSHQIPDLNSRVIWRDRLMAALSVAHPLAAEPTVNWQQLVGETFLVREGGTGPQVFDRIMRSSAGKWPTPEIRRVDVGRSALLSMISAGHGVSLFAADGAATNTANIVFLPIADESELVPFSAVWSPRNQNPSLRNLLDLTP